jgi:hypothetical protein
MGTPSKQLLKFMETYKVDSDEVWEVRSGGAWAIKHSALERVAAEQGIAFDPPMMLEFHAADKIAVLCVTGKQGERSEWSIGEATPYNNKNAYPFAMAEKRAKDRVVLKLLNAHGAVYSDAEADEFAATNGNGKPTSLPKKDAKEIYTKMQREVRECAAREQLKAWAEANKDRIAILPEDWQDILRLQYEEQMADLRQREAA